MYLNIEYAYVIYSTKTVRIFC